MDATDAMDAPEMSAITATPLQQAMLRKIAQSEYTGVNGTMPQNAEETETWADTIIETAEDKGVFTSLKNAGLVWHSGEKKDAGVGLTEEGFRLYQSIEERLSKVQVDVATPAVKPDAPRPWIVGLSGKPGAGKDTVAELLAEEHGFLKISISDPIYDDVAKAFRVEKAWLQRRDVKDAPQLRLSASFCENAKMYNILQRDGHLTSTAPRIPRAVLQSWGDALLKDDADYLVNKARDRAMKAMEARQPVVITGVQKLADMQMVESLAGITVRVRNPEVKRRMAQARQSGSAEANHPLENELRDVPMDLEIVNDGTLDDLQAKIPGLYAQIQTFETGQSTATSAAISQESILTALKGVPDLTIEPSPHATKVLITDSRSQHAYSITQQKEDFRVHVMEAEKEDYEDRFATLDDAMDFVRHEIFMAREIHVDESSPYYQALLNTLPGMPEAERKKMFLAVTGVMPDDWTGTLMKRRVVSRVANAYAAHFPASVMIDRVMERLVAASTRVNSLDLADAPLSPAADLPGATMPGATLPSARPFGTTDPIARAMLAKIEASPYTLPYLLSDDRARDVDDPPYEEDTEWAVARVQFADEIDAVLNARIRQNVDALGEREWMQPVLHGDLTRNGAVIHLDTLQDANDNLQGLAYQISLAADTEGNETRTVRDFLRGSSAQFANELHGIAEQIKQNLDQHMSVASVAEENTPQTSPEQAYLNREQSLFHDLVRAAQNFAVAVDTVLTNAANATAEVPIAKSLASTESDWSAENGLL